MNTKPNTVGRATLPISIAATVLFTSVALAGPRDQARTSATGSHTEREAAETLTRVLGNRPPPGRGRPFSYGRMLENMWKNAQEDVRKRHEQENNRPGPNPGGEGVPRV